MPYTDPQIDELLNQFPDWAYDPDRKQLITGLQFADFTEAMTFVNAVGELARNLNHYPNILLHEVNNVQIATTTLEEEGVTDQDAALVNEIEVLIASAEQRQATTPVAGAPVRQVGQDTTPVNPIPPVAPPPVTPAVSQPLPPLPETPQVNPPLAEPAPIQPMAAQPGVPPAQAIAPNQPVVPGQQGNLAGPSATNVTAQ